MFPFDLFGPACFGTGNFDFVHHTLVCGVRNRRIMGGDITFHLHNFTRPPPPPQHQDCLHARLGEYQHQVMCLHARLGE